MVHFVSSVKVPLLLWTILIASSSSGNAKSNMSDARIITSFLEKIIKPFIESSQLIDNKPRANYNTKEDNIIVTDVDNAIRLKIIQLKPMLQDSQNNHNTKTLRENKIKLQESTEADDETTIIEFVPGKKWRTKVKSALGETKQDTEKNIKKYKQLREHIKLLLGKEKTSRLTNKLITRTLDEMLSLLKEGQCKFKSIDTRYLMKHILKNTRKSMDKLTDKELDQYKLTCYMKRRDKDGKLRSNDDSSYSGYGRIKSKSTFGRDKNIRDENQCASFIVCSDELRRLFKMTYKHLNDTAVSTFRNYAAMYIRDIKEKTASVNDEITSVLHDLSKSTETTVNHVYLNELENFTLDDNKNKTANIEHINNFITATTGQIKSTLSRFVEDKMSASEINFISTIKDDLLYNLRMDMDNFSQKFADNICGLFVLCNGKNTHETRGLNKPRAFSPKDSENVYVKVQVSLDDELKDSLVRFGEEKLNSRQGNKTYQFGERLVTELNAVRRKYSHINVTRTTIRSTATTDGVVSSEIGLTDQFF